MKSLALLAPGLTLALLSSCGSGAAGIFAAASNEEEDRPPTASVLPNLVDAVNVAPTTVLRVEFSEPVTRASMLQGIRLYRLTNEAVESPQGLPTTSANFETIQTTLVLPTSASGVVAELAAVRNELVGGIPIQRTGRLHFRSWYRLEVTTVIRSEATGLNLQSVTSRDFRVGDGTFDTAELITFIPQQAVIAPTAAATLPSGEAIVLLEEAEGRRYFESRSLSTGGWTIPELAIVRNPSGPQLNGSGLLGSLSGRIYFANYDRNPTSQEAVIGDVGFAVSNRSEGWQSNPDLSPQQPLGSFDGSNAPGNNQSWWPRIGPVGEREAPATPPGGTVSTDPDGPESAIAAWMHMRDVDSAPIGLPMNAGGQPLPLGAFGAMNHTLRTQEMRARYFDTQDRDWESGVAGQPWRILSEGSTLPHQMIGTERVQFVSRPFILGSGGSGDAAVFWYQSSQPIPIYRNSGLDEGWRPEAVAGEVAPSTWQRTGTPVSDAWWPTTSGDEAFVVSRFVHTGNNAFVFEEPVRLPIGDMDPTNDRGLSVPLDVGATTDGRFVVVGLDPLATATSIPRIVAQVVDPSLMPGQQLPQRPLEFRSNGADIEVSFVIQAPWRNRAGSPISFRRLADDRFVLLVSGKVAGETDRLYSGIFDVATNAWMRVGVQPGDTVVPITPDRYNFDFVHQNASLIPGGVDPNMAQTDFVGISTIVDQTGNLLVVIDQLFDYNGNNLVADTREERELGLASFIRFDQRRFLTATGPNAFARGWLPPRPTIELETGNEIVHQRQPSVTAPNVDGEVFIVTNLKSHVSNAPNYNFAAGGLRFKFDASVLAGEAMNPIAP